MTNQERISQNHITIVAWVNTLEERIKNLDKEISNQALAISDEILTSSLTIPNSGWEWKDIDSVRSELNSFKSHMMEKYKELSGFIPKKVDVDQLWEFEQIETGKFLEMNDEIHKVKNDVYKALKTLD